MLKKNNGTTSTSRKYDYPFFAGATRHTKIFRDIYRDPTHQTQSVDLVGEFIEIEDIKNVLFLVNVRDPGDYLSIIFPGFFVRQ